MVHTAGSLAALVMLPWLSGCLVTEPMWRAANERVVAEPVPEGVLEPATEGGTRLLVVRYSWLGGNLYATIPLTLTVCPVEPFAYVGLHRTGAAIAGDLTPAHVQRLQAPRLTFRDEKWAERLQHNPRYRRREWSVNGMSGPHDVDYDAAPDAPPCRGRPEDNDVRIRALRLGRPWTGEEAEGMSVMREEPDVYPHDTCILVLPYARPRPAAHRRAAQVNAMLWTPVALLGDAVGVPFIYIACYGFGACP